MTTAQIRARNMALSMLALLMLLVFFQQLRQEPSLKQGLWAVFFSLPLLVGIQGLWRGKRNTYKWATMCVLPYFIVGITESVANASIRTWALTLLGASLLWFFSLVAYLRVSRPSSSED